MIDKNNVFVFYCSLFDFIAQLWVVLVAYIKVSEPYSVPILNYVAIVIYMLGHVTPSHKH